MSETDLVSRASRLQAIPSAAIEAYAAALPRLVIAVNELIAAHPRYPVWLAGNSPRFLEDNHRHHALFMNEVFSGGSFELLAATLPWVYHAYHAHGVPHDYFQAELNAWKQAVDAQVGADQAAPIHAVYDWMLSQHDTVIALAEARDAPREAVGLGLEDVFQALREAVLAFDDARVLDLCRGARDRGMNLSEILQRLIYPTMKHVGAQWEKDAITVADEHEITAIVNRVLVALYLEHSFPTATRGTALVASSVNEFHEMGAWMVATCLELDGWEVDYLGANVPAKDLVARAVEVRPRLIALSVAMPFNLTATRELIAELRAKVPETRVMIGGQVFELLPRLAEGMGADSCQQDCHAAMLWARENAAPPRD